MMDERLKQRYISILTGGSTTTAKMQVGLPHGLASLQTFHFRFITGFGSTSVAACWVLQGVSQTVLGLETCSKRHPVAPESLFLLVPWLL